MYFSNASRKTISKNLNLIRLMTIGLIDESNLFIKFNYLFIKSNALIFVTLIYINNAQDIR